MINQQHKKKIITLFSIGASLVNTGLILLIIIFFPVIQQELNYIGYQNKLAKASQIVDSDAASAQENIQLFTPVSEDFSVIIPKIGANAKVIANVNPFDEAVYQKALLEGVAHAYGSRLPNQSGTTFLFAHSTGSMLTVSRYNAIFYLLHKLETDDRIWLYYQGQSYEYKVIEKRVVNPQEVDYLSHSADENLLIMMTCTPAGTNLKRLLVIAKKISL